ncbi:MAG TPA: DUF1963 domain-containing protein [Actinospica sp.]|nr:DUF1963 domain-containing protein [Actinospica sp.]
MHFDDPAAAVAASVQRLGAVAGRQLAAMARRGFLLERSDNDAAASGRCRLGGPALLEPGTDWPQADRFPLSLLAVLDTTALADALGASLPSAAPGLLNFFYADPDVPVETLLRLDLLRPEAAQVVPADPALAVEASAPAPARVYPSIPVHARAVAMLPDSWDVEDTDIAFDKNEHWGAPSLVLDAMTGYDGNTADLHSAFGWPDTSYGNTVTVRDADGPAVHLLQLARDAHLGWGWGDAATLNFTIPARAFAASDFSAAQLTIQSC